MSCNCPSGELVAQKVLLDAYDKCVGDLLKTRSSSTEPLGRIDYVLGANKDEPAPPVPLIDLLKWFYPTAGSAVGLYEQVKEDLLSMGQENAQVFFNHFVQLNEELSLDVMNQARRRCCALVLEEGATGADLCLPAFDPQSGKLSLMVWIQVKNRNPKQMNDKSKQNLWWEHLHPHKIMPPSVDRPDAVPQVPSLSILFSLSPEQKETILPPKMRMEESSSVPVAFDEETVTQWEEEYNKSKSRKLGFWPWVRRGNAKKLKGRAKAWGEQIRALEEARDVAFSDAELKEEALKRVEMVTAPISYASVLMSDILEEHDDTPSLYKEQDIQTIKAILQIEPQQISAFDKDQRMLVISQHIDSMIGRFA